MRVGGLQEIQHGMKFLCFALITLFCVTRAADAQIVPLHAEFVYTSPDDKIPVIPIKTIDGDAVYELTLGPPLSPNDDTVYLILRLAGAGPEGRNFLEPKIWHGVQDFMFIAWDFAGGPEHSLSGAVREFHISKRKLHVTSRVSKASVRCVPNPDPQLQQHCAFNEIIIKVDVENAK